MGLFFSVNSYDFHKIHFFGYCENDNNLVCLAYKRREDLLWTSL